MGFIRSEQVNDVDIVYQQVNDVDIVASSADKPSVRPKALPTIVSSIVRVGPSRRGLRAVPAARLDDHHDAPEGRARWTLQLLSDKLVELKVVESISHECVRQVLKKRCKTLAKTDVVHSGTG